MRFVRQLLRDAFELARAMRPQSERVAPATFVEAARALGASVPPVDGGGLFSADELRAMRGTMSTALPPADFVALMVLGRRCQAKNARWAAMGAA